MHALSTHIVTYNGPQPVSTGPLAGFNHVAVEDTPSDDGLEVPSNQLMPSPSLADGLALLTQIADISALDFHGVSYTPGGLQRARELLQRMLENSMEGPPNSASGHDVLYWPSNNGPPLEVKISVCRETVTHDIANLDPNLPVQYQRVRIHSGAEPLYCDSCLGLFSTPPEIDPSAQLQVDDNGETYDPLLSVCQCESVAFETSQQVIDDGYWSDESDLELELLGGSIDVDHSSEDDGIELFRLFLQLLISKISDMIP
ncbi:hypothetical protein CC2G_004199 [Coprinopsis cinerea AmutBmut pab1-1]|nr:hypothetical protein CC2G_004199 [Coprinopsis cinerea AmutBmut pab1-1]